MKKTLKLSALFLAILLVFSGCGQSKKYDEKFTAKGKEIISHFGKKYDYNYFLKDISSIDLELKPDFDSKKYTVKKVEDEDSTSKTQYYKNGKLIYEDAQGFGEAFYIHHTETKSGADAEVYYYHDESGRVFNVVVKTDVYTANIDLQNKSEKSDLPTVIITAEKKSEGKLNESIMYSAYDGIILVEKALYYDKVGYIDYFSWIGIDDKLHENVTVKFSELKSSTDESTVKKIKNDMDISIIQTLMGRHRLAYKNDKWFITTDLYVLFSDKNGAEKYAEKSGISKENISSEYALNDGTFYVVYKDITLPISEKFKLNDDGDFNELVLSEFDDMTFADIITDDSGQVTEISYNNSTLSCY